MQTVIQFAVRFCAIAQNKGNLNTIDCGKIKMAIYHFSMKTISRSHGRSATAAIAYRTGQKIIDARTGEIHDYQKKNGVLETGIVLPNGAPVWAQNREQLWNAVEQKETRKNSTVAREIIIALPSELNQQVRAKMVHEFAMKLVERHGCAVDYAIHEPSKQGDERNYHAHVLMSTRRLTPQGFSEKTRELDERNSGEIGYWRAEWATHVNHHLSINGFSEQVSHLSFVEQGITREPTRHKGVAATAIERRQAEQLYITAKQEPINTIYFEKVIIEESNAVLVENISVTERRLENLLEQRDCLRQENSLNLQYLEYSYREMLASLPQTEQDKLTVLHRNRLNEIENMAFDDDDVKTELLLSIYSTFHDEINEVIKQLPEPEIRDCWEQCLDCLHDAHSQVNNLIDELNILEQSGMGLFQVMDNSGLYAYQGIKSLKDDLKKQVQPLSEYLDSLKSEVERAIQAWERNDIDGATVFSDYNSKLDKTTLNIDFKSKIDNFKSSQEQLKIFLQNYEQRFQVRLAEPRANELTIGSPKLAEPRFMGLD